MGNFTELIHPDEQILIEENYDIEVEIDFKWNANSAIRTAFLQTI